jgi:hypothetical protein
LLETLLTRIVDPIWLVTQGEPHAANG